MEWSEKEKLFSRALLFSTPKNLASGDHLLNGLNLGHHLGHLRSIHFEED